MKLVKAIVRPNKVDEVKDALAACNVGGMTVTEVRGHGRQRGHSAVYRGREYEVSLLPKMKIEAVVPDENGGGRDRRDHVRSQSRRWAGLRDPGRRKP